MSDHWLQHVVTLLSAETSDLRSLALMCRRDPTGFYLGTSLDGLDLDGQDLRGLGLSDVTSKQGFDEANGVQPPLQILEADEAVVGTPAPDDGEPRSFDELTSVSVVVVVRGRSAALEQSVASALLDPTASELIVVATGSSAANDDATFQKLQQLQSFASQKPTVTLISSERPGGLAASANHGARSAGGNILVFLDSDVTLLPGCTAHLVRELQHWPAPCIVGAQVLNSNFVERDGNSQSEVTPLAILAAIANGPRTELKRHDLPDLPDRPRRVHTVSSCFCIRREDFNAVGGFDEAYFSHVEDVDLCWRVRERGGSVVLHPKAEALRLGAGPSAGEWRVELQKGAGLARYFRKRAQTPVQRLGAWLMSPLVLAAAVARPLIQRDRQGGRRDPGR